MCRTDGAGHCDPDLLIPIPSMLFQGLLYTTALPNELQSMTCGDRGEHDFAKRRSELDIWIPLPTKPGEPDFAKGTVELDIWSPF